VKNHYDFIIIGGGPAGTPMAMALASAGQQVLLIEKGQGLGGTCLFEGCIPSKILRESARRLREVREATEFGLCFPSMDIHIDWSAIQQRKRRILDRRSAAAMQRLEHLPNLDLVLGIATFTDANHARITGHNGELQTVEFTQAIIATGSTPSRPSIPGIDHHRVLDSEAILEIDHIPTSLTIIGAGPIGVELGQIFTTFGSEVTLLEAGPHILGPIDQELAGRLKQKMIGEGIRVTTECRIKRISNTGGGLFVEYQNTANESLHSLADTVLIVTGRLPNITGLGLENTRVKHGKRGIEVSGQLQTGERNIYAVGDVIGQPMFAHWATAQGLALVRNLLGQTIPFPETNSNSAVIFSEPEIGMVGLTEAAADAVGIEFEVARYDFTQDARAQIANRDDGLLKIVYERNSHRILGVHALVEGAADLIGEASLAVKAGIPLEALAGSIHPHPTLTESFGFAARAALAKKPLTS